METTNSHRALLFALLASALALNISTAQAETVNCTAITTIPAVINTSGVYCLKSNKSTNITTGAAITINSDNVAVDLNGFVLKGVSGSGTTGISASQRYNIRIKNGAITGFSFGISLFDYPGKRYSMKNVVEDMLIDQIENTGILARGRITIRNNHIIDAKNTGIRIDGTSPAAIGNVVEGSATGIAFHEGLAFSSEALAQGNRIIRSDVGIDLRQASGKYLDNLTMRVATPFLQGPYPSMTNAGNNK